MGAGARSRVAFLSAVVKRLSLGSARSKARIKFKGLPLSFIHSAI